MNDEVAAQKGTRIQKFSETSVLKLPVGYHRDPGESLLYVRVTKAGTRTYVTRFDSYASGKRKQCQRTLGDVGHLELKEARRMAREQNPDLIESEETQTKRKTEAIRSQHTASRAWDAYMMFKKQQYRCPDETVTNRLPKMLQELTYAGRHFQEHFGDTALSEITAADIRNFLAPLQHRHVTAAKNRLNYLSGFFSHFLKTVPGLLTVNPCSLVTIKLPARTEVVALDDDDIGVFVNAVNGHIKPEYPVEAAALLFLLTSGQRPEETLNLMWEPPKKNADFANYVDLHVDELVFGDHKTRRYYKDPLVVALTPGARSVLESIERDPTNPYVFPGYRRRDGEPGHVDISTVRKRFKTVIDIVAEERNWSNAKRQKFTLYKLRGTYASHASKTMTLPELMVQMKHLHPSTAAVYYLSRKEVRKGIKNKSPDFLGMNKQKKEEVLNEDVLDG